VSAKPTLPDPPGLLGAAALAPLAQVRPMLAMRAACGFPSPAEGFFAEDDRLDLNELLIANPPATFFARADCGASMVDFGIQAGDILVIDRSLTPRHGQIVLVLWQGGFTVKQLYARGSRVELRASQGIAPIIVGEDVELDVWGVVTWTVHHHG
jgi:DNA polymerase V